MDCIMTTAAHAARGAPAARSVEARHEGGHFQRTDRVQATPASPRASAPGGACMNWESDLEYMCKMYEFRRPPAVECCARSCLRRC